MGPTRYSEPGGRSAQGGAPTPDHAPEVKAGSGTALSHSAAVKAPHHRSSPAGSAWQPQRDDEETATLGQACYLPAATRHAPRQEKDVDPEQDKRHPDRAELIQDIQVFAQDNPDYFANPGSPVGFDGWSGKADEPVCFKPPVWMNQMRESDQLDYYERREREQHDRAARASIASHRDFHAHLARHYGGLKEEMRSLQTGPTLSPF